MKTTLFSPLRHLVRYATLFVSLFGLSSLLHATAIHGTGTWNQYARVQSTGGGSGIRHSVVLHISQPLKGDDLARYQGYVSHDTSDGRKELAALVRSMNTQDKTDPALAELAKQIDNGQLIGGWTVTAFHDYNPFALINDGVELIVEKNLTADEFAQVCKFFEGDSTDEVKEALRRVFQGNEGARILLKL